jgi:hypothetical protein
MSARMKTLLAVALVGCTSSSSSSSPPTYLPADAAFIEPTVPQCLQQYPNALGHPCCQALTFYTTGDVSKDSGEEGFPGHYELDDHVATGVLFGRDFAFDFETNTATGQPLIAGVWIADTNHLIATACLPI